MDLREWAILYVKHRDALARKLTGHEERDGRVIFTFKDHTMHAYVMEKLDVPRVDGKTFLFTLQTRENVETLLKRWKEFSAMRDLTIVFANPERNEKWLIHPHTHESISEGKVEQGIRTMANEASFV